MGLTSFGQQRSVGVADELLLFEGGAMPFFPFIVLELLFAGRFFVRCFEWIAEVVTALAVTLQQFF